MQEFEVISASQIRQCLMTWWRKSAHSTTACWWQDAKLFLRVALWNSSFSLSEPVGLLVKSRSFAERPWLLSIGLGIQLTPMLTLLQPILSLENIKKRKCFLFLANMVIPYHIREKFIILMDALGKCYTNFWICYAPYSSLQTIESLKLPGL